MKKLLFSLFLLLPTLAFSQVFEKAVGIRGGQTSGFEFRFYTDDVHSYKFLLGTRDDGLQFHAFKEFHEYDMFTFTDQLVFFYGFGAHVGYEQWDEYHVANNTSWYEERTSLIAGIDALAGVEYVFYEVPVSIGFEVKPFVDVFGKNDVDIELFDFAFTVKYLF